MSWLDPGTWPLGVVAGVFVALAVVIAVVGSRLTRLADTLADATGLGEAVFGAVLLGGATSLPGITASVSAAWLGHPELAVSNALGGIAVQTAFLAVADVVHREANLEHAAASVENLVQCALLVALLSMPIAAASLPPFAVFGIHPLTVVLVLTYIAGIRLVRSSGSSHLWEPTMTPESRPDEPGQDIPSGRALVRTWLAFVLLALVVASAGYGVAQTGIALADRTGISQTVVGTMLTAVATSLPELVTSIAAVRQGALTLAVGGIIGGNSFDVLFLAFSDIAFREGSIYAAIGPRQVFWMALTILLAAVLLLGLLRRERKGFGNIGFESVLVLVLYLSGVALEVYQG